MTRLDIAQLRFYNQGLESPSFTEASDVVAWFGAVQAQDYKAAKWALGVRLPAKTAADIEHDLAQRTIVRTWPMRGTIHLVPAEDAHWMLELLTPRVLASSAGRYRQLELDEAVFSQSRDLLIKALVGGKQLTRAVLYQHLEAAGVATAQGRGMHILGHLAQQGVLCFGSYEGKQPTFALLDEWVTSASTLAREEALVTLALRYFRSHGPATLQDFVWWSGLRVAEAKVGLELAKAALEKIQVDEKTYWFMPTELPEESPSPKEGQLMGHLLPWFDEYLVAYKDRSAVLEPSFNKAVNAGGGLLNPTLVIKGQVIGTWKRVFKKDRVVINLSYFGTPSKTQKQAVAEAAERYGRFLAVPYSVERKGE